jgi:predicted permease
MSRIPGLRRHFRLPWRTERTLREEVDEELRFHLDMRAAELAQRRGLDPEAARAEALRQFGDLEDARDYIRSMDRRTETTTWRRDVLNAFRQDLTQSWRGLRRSPAFTTIVVLALALGIGMTTAIFTLVNALMLRPLPLVDTEALVGFGDPSLVSTISSGSPRSDLFSYPLYVDLRDRGRTVRGLLAAGTPGPLDVVIDPSRDPAAERESVEPRLVSGNYFEVLGVRAAIGRTLNATDDSAPGGSPVAVISHDFWERRFDLDPGVLGRTILVDRTPVTIVGVTPPGFFGEIVGIPMDVWMPLTLQPLLMPNQDRLRDRNVNWLLLMGRLAPGATVARAEAEFTAITRQAFLEEGAASRGENAPAPVVDAFPAARGFSNVRAEAGLVLTTVMGLAALVLFVVCANVANLLLARASSRRTEIGVRLALGAGRLRVLRHLLTETLLLGAAAGVLALLVVNTGRVMLVRYVESSGQTFNFDLSFDVRVLAFAGALSLLTALLLGLVPALRATRVELPTALRSHARGVSGDPLGGGGRRLGLGKWLVIGQVAVSLVLLTGTGLLLRSAWNLQRVDLGVARDELLLVEVDATAAGYEGPRLQALQRQLAERLERLPGVAAVSYSQLGILSGSEITTTHQVPGFVARADEDTVSSTDRVGPGYFQTVGARLLRGRDIGPRDDARAPLVTVINETMARFYFPGRDPIGQYIQLDTRRYQVVGVVADVKVQTLRTEPTRRFYTPAAQDEASGFTFVLRTRGAPGAGLALAIRREILAADAVLRVGRAEPLADRVSRSMEAERVMAQLAATAGGLALVLSLLGLYGVMTYTTVRRTGEFGLRMALGAGPAELTRMVLRETMVLLAIGALIGVPAAIAAGRLLRSQLVGVGVVDLPSLAAALGVLAASAALAGYRPASRAAHVQPQVALSRE